MSGAETEGRLRDWRYGQAQAERLTAAVLHLEGYEDVDPQHPLGGPDGLKDVVCRRAGLRWVAAAYFPTTSASFGQIADKFTSDLEGVAGNSADAFAFFTNRSLTVGEREKLLDAAAPVRTEIYHLERLCGVLNAPKGCGIRLEYLRIAMTEEEQWSFWSTMNADVIDRLTANELRRESQLNALGDKLDLLIARTSALELNLQAQPSSLTPLSAAEQIDFPTARLSIGALNWIHRLVTDELGIAEALRGRFRAVQVWIGDSGSSPATAVYRPPAPTEVPRLVLDWLNWWHETHPTLVGQSKEVACGRLAEFHHRLLHIHPYLDANGRVARVLLDQAAREILNQGVGKEFTREPDEYFTALAAGDRGDYGPLTDRIAASLV
jgi:fido (protein-threonine AMPylation protein)